MQRKQKIKHMTSEELKAQLYAHFHNSGSLDSMKAQLRGQLVSKLVKLSESAACDKFPKASEVKKCVLPLQLCNWLVCDHLSRHQYQYSLSTFVTESQLPYPQKTLTAGDILELLGMKSSIDFENITKLYSENNELGYQYSLLLAILKTSFNIPNKASFLNDSRYENSEAGRDASIHDEFSKLELLTSNKSMPKNDDCTLDEKSFLCNIKKESKNEVQKLRHKLLQELEDLHSREHEIKQTESELRDGLDKLSKEKADLKNKEALIEKEIRNEFETKMRKVESDFASKLFIKDKEIESLKMELVDKNGRLSHADTELATEKHSSSLLKQNIDDLKNTHQIIQDKYSSLLDQNTCVLKKFESMSDYSILKDELATKSREITRLQNEIKDICQKSEAEKRKFVETVKSLEDNLSRKEPELYQAKEELERIKNILRNEQSTWNKDRIRLEAELCGLREIFAERMKEIGDLHKTNQILNYKLTNNLFNMAKSGSFHSYKNFQSLNYDTVPKSRPETLFMKRNLSLQQQQLKEDDTSLKFILDAKKRCKKLEQDDGGVRDQVSVIFNTMPATTGKWESYLENDRLTMPSVNYNNRSFVNYTKIPHLLNDVKQMNAPSLFQMQNKQTDSSSFAASSHVPNVINDRFKDVSKISELYSINKQQQFETGNSTSFSKTIIHRNSSDESSTMINGDLLTKNVDNKTEIGEEKNDRKGLDIDVTSNNSQEDEKDSSLESSNQSSAQVKKNIADTASKNSDAISKETLHNLDKRMKSDSAANQSSQIPSGVSDNMKSKITENIPESTAPVVINLDEAWKKRSSLTDSRIPDSASLKYKVDDPQITNPIGTLFGIAKQAPKSSLKQSNELKQSAKTTVEISNPVESLSRVLGTTEHSSNLNLPPSNNNKNTYHELDQSLGQTEAKNAGPAAESELACSEKDASSNDSTTDKKIKKRDDHELDVTASTIKTDSSESLNELSDLHFSCGSEKEFPNEDSDAW